MTTPLTTPNSGSNLCITAVHMKVLNEGERQLRVTMYLLHILCSVWATSRTAFASTTAFHTGGLKTALHTGGLKTALPTGGLRFGTYCLLTVEKLILSNFQREAKSHDRIAPFIFLFKFFVSFFNYLFIIELYFTLYVYFISF